MQRKFIAAAAALVLAILASYSPYFSSELHVGDYTTVRDNASLRTLTNLPRFFVDTSTTSTVPAGYSYQPVATTSLALDYFIGKGSPVVFHLTNLLIFLACLAVICWLFLRLFETAVPDPANPFLALFATALLGLHPAAAEMVNSVSRRGELLAVLGVVSGIALYAAFPSWRNLGLYLVPPLLGLLSHPGALIFAPLLLAYMVLIEPPPADDQVTPDQLRSRDETQETAQRQTAIPTRIRIRRRKHPFRRYVKAQFKRFAPALAFTVVACGFAWLLSPPVTHAPGESLVRYWFTQPWVALRYFGSFFVPVGLSPASDLTVFNSFDYRAVLGTLFLILLVILTLVLAPNRPLRPMVFGLWWFLLGLAPGSLFLQPEVASDRRMFLPFIGLALSVTWAARRLLPGGPALRRLQAMVAVAVLIAFAAGTYVRNRVWQSEESLWRDNVAKNPGNARGLLNYGLALASRGKNAEAYDYLQRAYRLNPWSAPVQAALASVSAALRHDTEAEEHFRLARQIDAGESTSHMPYAEWLEKQGRLKEAIDAYAWASSLAPSDMRPRYALMRLYKATHDWDNLRKAVEAASRIAPGDEATRPFVETSRLYPDAIRGAEKMARNEPNADNYLTLAEAYCMSTRYEDCLKTAKKVLEIRPDSADGYNVLGAAYASLGRFDDGIAAVRKALELNPNLGTARSNLNSWEARVAADAR